MRPDLWVIWLSLLILVATLGGSIGSRFFPSQDRLDAEHEAGYLLGRGDEAREWERELEPPGPGHWGWRPVPAAEWNDTVENMAALGRAHYEPLARGAGDLVPPVTTASWPGDLVTKHHDPLKGDSPVPGLPESPIFDQLCAEFAAHKLPGPAMVPDEMSGRPGVTTAHETAGPGPDPAFAALDDAAAFAMIEFDLKLLKVLAAEDFKLTPWRT